MFSSIRSFVRDNHPRFCELAKRYRCSVLHFYLDFLWCRRNLKADSSEYFTLELYRLSKIERKTYLFIKVSRAWEAKLNSKNDRRIFKDKEETNRLFSSMVHRRWIPAYKISEKEIQDFLQLPELGEYVFIKPLAGHKGIGIEKVKVTELRHELPEKMTAIQEQKCIIEEGIVQHPLLDSIYSKSVNTLRVATILKKDGTAQVLGCSLRCGCGDMTVDNFSSGGVQFPIDVASGIVIGPGNRCDGSHHCCHPDSGVQVLGMKIPHYNEIVKACTEAARTIPTSRYLGWDIAVTKSGFDLVEINIGQGINGMQQDKVGKYYQLKDLL